MNEDKIKKHVILQSGKYDKYLMKYGFYFYVNTFRPGWKFWRLALQSGQFATVTNFATICLN